MVKKVIEKAIKEKDIIIIDEIGKTELLSNVFKEKVNEALKSDKSVIAVLHRNYVKDFKDKGIIFKVNRENFREIREI